KRPESPNLARLGVVPVSRRAPTNDHHPKWGCLPQPLRKNAGRTNNDVDSLELLDAADEENDSLVIEPERLSRRFGSARAKPVKINSTGHDTYTRLDGPIVGFEMSPVYRRRRDDLIGGSHSQALDCHACVALLLVDATVDLVFQLSERVKHG